MINTVGAAQGLLQGLSEPELATVVDLLRPVQFPTGATLLSAGQTSQMMYLIVSGTVDVLIQDSQGAQRDVGPLRAGATCGEMSFLTGHPATATVVARTPVTALAMTRPDFAEIVASYPAIYRNVGVIVAQRLVQADRRSSPPAAGTVTWLIDYGAPPLFGLALACSMAWHTRRQITLVVPDMDHLGDIAKAAGLSLSRRPEDTVRLAQHLRLTVPHAPTGSSILDTVATLRQAGSHVLAVVPPSHQNRPAEDQVVHLVGTDSSSPPPPAAGAKTVRAWTASEGKGGSGWMVPAPTAADVAAIRDGVMALNTATGRAIGRVARELTNLRVGLALGAGSAKGFAHIGVLNSLERHGVPCDRIAGTSIGAAVAGLHAAGFTPSATLAALADVGSATFRPVVPRASLMSHEGVARKMRDTWGPTTRIEDLSVPLAIVAADMVTGREVIFRRGLLWAAALASITIPGVYPPQRMGPHLLIDGGVLNPVPVGVTRDMGADLIIAVRLATRQQSPALDLESTRPSGKAPSVLHTLLRARDMEGNSDINGSTTAVIEPKFPPNTGLGLRDFAKGQRFIEAGEEAAEAAIPLLARKLPWLNPQ
jgi:NTE family protein